MSFHEKLLPHYHAFLSQVKNRKSQNGNLEWLFHSSSKVAFTPDYFELGKFGRTRLERRLCAVIFFIPLLWEKLIWRRIKKAILRATEKKYLPDILQQTHHYGQPHMDEFLSALHTLFKQNTTLIKQATFTEVYSYLNQCLQEFSAYVGGPTDIYKTHKLEHNVFCLRIYQEIKPSVLEHNHAFELACFLSIRANWIDCVEDSVNSFLNSYLEEVSSLMEEKEVIHFHESENPYFHLSSLKNCLKTPKTILFESDNSGEIVLDLLFIEWMLKQGHQIYIASKTSPVLNDITYQDMQQLLTHKAFSDLLPYLESKQLQLIDTHSRVSGKYIPGVSTEYKQAYNQANLLILKGQGNFQAMPMGRRKGRTFHPYPYKKPIVYMMGLKAPFISQCFESLLHKGPSPKLQLPFLYYFDSKNKSTYPQ